MHESALIRLETQMQTRQWDSLPLEKLGELLCEAQVIHRELPSAGKSRAEIVITHVRGLIQARESDNRHRELQERLSGMHTVLDRSEKLAGRFEQQMEKLLTVVEQQRLLAEKLDHQTRTVVRLTWGLFVLTGGLFILTVALLIKEMTSGPHAGTEPSQHVNQPATNPTNSLTNR
jgi:predicted nuclease with TOPRIM domain